MGKCEVRISASENERAFKLYKALAAQGVTCDEMDVGYGVTNLTGKECPGAGDLACRRGVKDGVVGPQDVFEYALDRYEKHQKLLENIMGRPLPWVLDDLNPATKDDEAIRNRIGAAIDKCKEVLKAKGVTPGTEEYDEKLAVGLTYFNSYVETRLLAKASAKTKKRLGTWAKELERAGLGEFARYVHKHGGLRTRDDPEEEYSALESLRRSQGKCTEYAKILYATLKQAGLAPHFIYVEKVDQGFLKQEEGPNPITRGQRHLCVGIKVRGQWRLLDSSFQISNPRHEAFYPWTLRQALSFDASNAALYLLKKQQPAAGIARCNDAIALDPLNFSAWSNRGVLFGVMDQYDKALQSCREAMRLYPLAQVPYVCAGDAWRDKGDHAKALEHYATALRLDPAFAAAYLGRASIWYLKNDYKKALAELDVAIKLDPEFAEAYLRRGKIFGILGKIDRAQADFTKFVELEKGNADGFDLRGYTYYQQQNLKKALADFDRAIVIDPKHVMAHIHRASVFADMGQFDKALVESSRAVALDPKKAEAHAANCNSLAGTGAIDQAFAACEEAIRINPKFPGPYAMRGALNAARRRHKEALPDISIAIKLMPQEAKFRLLRGRTLFEMGEIDKAIPDLAEAVRLDPSLMDAFVLWADAWAKKDKPRESIEHFNRMLASYPKSTLLHFYRGHAQMRIGNFDEAIADYTKGLKDHPNQAGMYYFRGLCWYAGKSDNDKAIADFTEAIRLKPRFAEAYLNRGKAWESKGQQAKAEADFKAAARIRQGLPAE